MDEAEGTDDDEAEDIEAEEDAEIERSTRGLEQDRFRLATGPSGRRRDDVRSAGCVKSR